MRELFRMSPLSGFKDSVGVIVSSCDSFFDAWRPFDAFLRKFWPDCPFEIRLITNDLEIHSSRVHALRVGPDKCWSSNLLSALSQVSHPYLLYVQEDYFLTGPVQTKQFAQDFHEAIEIGADSLCFRARLPLLPGFRPINDRYGVVALDSDGRTRCQITLWKRSSLQRILRPDESAWDFEARGSARTREMKILSYQRRENTPIPYLMSAISRGLWMPEAIALCREHQIQIEPFFRPLSSPQSWRRRLRRTLGRARLKRALRAQQGTPIKLP